MSRGTKQTAKEMEATVKRFQRQAKDAEAEASYQDKVGKQAMMSGVDSALGAVGSAANLVPLYGSKAQGRRGHEKCRVLPACSGRSEEGREGPHFQEWGRFLEALVSRKCQND